MSGRAIIIRDLDQARAALAAAAGLGVPVTLRSAPGAAATLGAMVFARIVAEARAAFPTVRVRAVLDCGGDPGLVLNALRHGIDGVRCTVADDVRRRLADIAARHGAVLDEDPTPGFDLAAADDPVTACRDWLAATG